MTCARTIVLVMGLAVIVMMARAGDALALDEPVPASDAAEPAEAPAADVSPGDEPWAELDRKKKEGFRAEFPGEGGEARFVAQGVQELGVAPSGELQRQITVREEAFEREAW